jgi:hypothetical protein
MVIAQIMLYELNICFLHCIVICLLVITIWDCICSLTCGCKFYVVVSTWWTLHSFSSPRLNETSAYLWLSCGLDLGPTGLVLLGSGGATLARLERRWWKVTRGAVVALWIGGMGGHSSHKWGRCGGMSRHFGACVETLFGGLIDGCNTLQTRRRAVSESFQACFHGFVAASPFCSR